MHVAQISKCGPCSLESVNKLFSLRIAPVGELPRPRSMACEFFSHGRNHHDGMMECRLIALLIVVRSSGK